MAFNNKLFKLKKYFSIEETAERLTSTLGEDVSVVDVLSLAIDHHLIISVIIEEEMYGVYSKFKKTTKGEFFNVNDDGRYQDIFKNIRYMPLSERNQEIELVEHLSQIIYVPYGCYDLPMKGAERLDVLWLYEQKKGKCPKEWADLDGAFLCFGDYYINIMSMFDSKKIDVDYSKGRNAFIDKETKEPITKDNYGSYFYPAGGLVYANGDQDIEFVFKRENIEKFEQSLLENEDEINFEQSKKLIALILKALKEKGSKSWSQDDLSTYISEELIIYGLGKTKINKFFAQCNKLVKSNK